MSVADVFEECGGECGQDGVQVGRLGDVLFVVGVGRRLGIGGCGLGVGGQAAGLVKISV